MSGTLWSLQVSNVVTLVTPALGNHGTGHARSPEQGMLVRRTSMPCSPYKPGLFTAQTCPVRRNTFRLVVKTRTYVWACTYVRIGLHIRMYRLIRTYVQSTSSPHQVASSPSPFILSFLVKPSINQPVKNDSTSPHDPFSHRYESFHTSAFSGFTACADERRLKGPDGVSFHSRNPHQQGVSATNERMKGKVESRQYCGLFEGVAMQENVVFGQCRAGIQ